MYSDGGQRRIGENGPEEPIILGDVEYRSHEGA